MNVGLQIIRVSAIIFGALAFGCQPGRAELGRFETSYGPTAVSVVIDRMVAAEDPGVVFAYGEVSYSGMQAIETIDLGYLELTIDGVTSRNIGVNAKIWLSPNGIRVNRETYVGKVYWVFPGRISDYGRGEISLRVVPGHSTQGYRISCISYARQEAQGQ